MACRRIASWRSTAAFIASGWCSERLVLLSISVKRKATVPIDRSRSLMAESPDNIQAGATGCKLQVAGAVCTRRHSYYITCLYHLPGPVLHRLRQMRRLYLLASRQIRYRPRQLQYAVVSPGAQVQLPHSRLDERLSSRVQLAILAYLGGSHFSIARYALDTLEPLSLALAGGFHSCSDGGGRLALALVGELFVFDAWHLDVDVYAVEEGAGEALLVAGYHCRGAGALLHRVPAKTARARVHGTDQNEVGGERQGAACAADGY